MTTKIIIEMTEDEYQEYKKYLDSLNAKKRKTCSDCVYFNAAENVCSSTLFGYQVNPEGEPCEKFYSREKYEKECDDL